MVRTKCHRTKCHWLRRVEGAASALTITAVLAGWWAEAEARGLKISTYESYRNTTTALIAFLHHDDAARVTPEDILRYKDHRLASVNPRTGKRISAKTVKDCDLGGLKSIFGWAVSNRKLPINPAAGITLRVAKAVRLRSKGFTDAEAKAILTGPSTISAASERGHRWPPPNAGCHGCAPIPGRGSVRWCNYGSRPTAGW